MAHAHALPPPPRRAKDDPKAQEFLQGHTDKVSCIALSPSGRYLASGQSTYLGFVADICVWDLEARSLVHRLQLQKVGGAHAARRGRGPGNRANPGRPGAAAWPLAMAACQQALRRAPAAACSLPDCGGRAASLPARG
jgi:hypothetical protein